jgi:hypothetical protein
MLALAGMYWRRASGREDPAGRCALNAALIVELEEGFAEPVVVDAQGIAKGAAGLGKFCRAEEVDEAIGDAGLVMGGEIGADGQMNGAIVRGAEFYFEGVGGLGRAVFKGHDKAMLPSRQIGIGIAKGVKVRAAAKGLSGLCALPLAGMVYEDHSAVMGALELAQVAQQFGDIGGGIFIEAVQSDQGIEKEQAWLIALEGFVEAALIGAEVQAQAWCGDGKKRERSDVEAPVPAERQNAAANGGQGILSQIDQDRALGIDREASQAGGPGCDADRHIQSQP